MISVVRIPLFQYLWSSIRVRILCCVKHTNLESSKWPLIVVEKYSSLLEPSFILRHLCALVRSFLPVLFSSVRFTIRLSGSGLFATFSKQVYPQWGRFFQMSLFLFGRGFVNCVSFIKQTKTNVVHLPSRLLAL